MNDVLVDGIRITLKGEERLPLSVVLRESPAYSGPRNFFTVTLSNESEAPRLLPFDELRRNIVLIYRNPVTREERVDNRTPPPKMDGAVERLPPGASLQFEVVFEYPQGLVAMDDEKIARLDFCVAWKTEWLRSSAYTPGSYDWNPTFEACRSLQLVDDYSDRQ